MVAALYAQDGETHPPQRRDDFAPRVTEASAAYSDGDTLHSDELRGDSNISVNFQTQFNGLANSLDQLIKRARLSVAPRQLWNARHIVALLVALDDNAEFTFAGFSHEDGMPEIGYVRKAARSSALFLDRAAAFDRSAGRPDEVRLALDSARPD